MSTERPYRIGTTSYIVPADILPNVEFLAERVDDIELVLFESKEASNLPSRDDIKALQNWQQKADLSFTVHLPIDAPLGDEDEAVRQDAVARCLRVLELTKPLKPFAWLLHLDGRQRGEQPARDVDGWLAALERSVRSIVGQTSSSADSFSNLRTRTSSPPADSVADLRTGTRLREATPGKLSAPHLGPSGFEARDLCVETLDYPFELIEPLVRRYGLSVCLDVGHLLMWKRSVDKHFDRFGDLCRVVHLHGIRDGKDHRDIGAIERSVLQGLLARLGAPNAPHRVLTLEVFGREDFEASMKCLKEIQ